MGKIYYKQPQILCLETTTACNGNCLSCGMHIRRPPPVYMSFDLYTRIVQHFRNARDVVPLSFGEPLMHPNIVEMVEFAAQSGKKVTITTNGQLLDGPMSEKLLNAGLRELHISVDAGDPETYAMLRPMFDWDLLVHNTKAFINTRKRLDKGCLVIARITITPENKHTVADARKFWSSLVGHAWSKPEIDIPDPDLEELWTNEPLRGRARACRRPFKTLVVKVDGTVVPCCNDWWGQYPMGNAITDDLSKIFNNKYFKDLRKAMNSGGRRMAICDCCVSPHRRHNK